MPPSPPRIRYAIPSDLDALEEIDLLTDEPAGDLQWAKYMQKRCYRVLVIEHRQCIEAACVLKTEPGAIYIERLVAHHDFDETLAASMFLQDLCGGIEVYGIDTRLVLQIDEYDVDWQMFLKERGFKCMQTLRGGGDNRHDVLVFEFGADLVKEYA